MLYHIDTADREKIRHCCEFFPIDGVTTNPTIISKEKTDFGTLIKDIRNIIGADRMLHIQVTSSTAEGMVKEAAALKDFVGGNLYIKVPICAEGLKATREIKKMGLGVTETAIFTQQQALMAAKAGADFVAPYVNRLDNIVSDGVNVVLEIVELLRTQGLDTKVLAASFKTVEQVHKITMAGTQSVTLNPDLFDNLLYHPMSLMAIDAFSADWETVYDDKKIKDLI